LNHSEAPAVERSRTAAPLNRRVSSLRLPQEAKSGKTGLAWLGWLLCFLFAGTSGWLAYVVYSQRGVNPSVSDPDAVSPPSVSSSAPAASTTAESGEIALEATGYVIPAHQILVSPQVSGRLLSVHIEEGMRVAKDQVLAEIEKTDYLADCDRDRASLELAKQRLLELERGNRPEEIAQAEFELKEAEAQLPQMKAEWERNEQLRGTTSVTQLEYEKSLSAYEALRKRIERLSFALKLMRAGPREERIAAARAEVRQQEAEVSKSSWRLDNCTVRAPISGTILRKNAEEGNIVNPVAFNGSYSLCEMANLAQLEVELNIEERDISRVFKGQKCRVRAEAFKDRMYAGSVSRLMPIADRAKGAVPVRVVLDVPADEEGVYLKPEMRATVSFLRERQSTQTTSVESLNDTGSTRRQRRRTNNEQ
jgi:multidrug resistance efflux pump